TFLTTFAVVLNNHSVAACCALFAIHPALKILAGAESSGQAVTIDKVSSRTQLVSSYLLSGFFAGLTATIELPAAAFCVGLGVLLLRESSTKALLLYVPIAALPAAGLLLTNYCAI